MTVTKQKPWHDVQGWNDVRRPGSNVLQDPWVVLRMVVESSHLRPAPKIPTPIRTLEIDDVGAIQSLYQHWGDTFFDELMLRSGVYCGVFDGDELVAVAGTHVVSHRWKLAGIGGVFTHPAHRGQGLGTAVTGAVTRILSEQGIDLIVLNVREDNAQAISAYRRLGFSVLKSYWEGNAILR